MVDGNKLILWQVWVAFTLRLQDAREQKFSVGMEFSVRLGFVRLISLIINHYATPGDKTPQHGFTAAGNFRWPLGSTTAGDDSQPSH